jgi:hypothetical protein
MPPRTIAQVNADKAKETTAQVSINLDDYCLAEKIALELALGEPLGELFPTRRVIPYRALAGLAWLTKRRTNPALTWTAFVDSGDENWTGVAMDPTAPGESPGDEPERSPGSSASTRASA